MNIKLKGSGSMKLRMVTLATTVAISGVAAFVPFAAVADHTTAHTIEQLSAQILQLQAQLASLSGGTPPSAPAAGSCSFTRSLTVGVRGDDVTCLQDYLTSTGHYTYSGGSTGYFGNITRSAVAAWQAASGVSPAVGYFGVISRAKYDSMVVVVVPPPPPTPPPPPPGTPPPPPAVGTGLTVTSAVSQPDAIIVPESAARVPFVKAVLTASADGDITVKSVTVERRGLADDAAFDAIIILDEDSAQIGNSKTLSSDHKVVLNESFTVKAGTSKTVTIAANMNSSLDNYSGQVGRLAVVAVDAGTSAVNASLPIEGNGMTLNSTLAIGTVTMSIGSLDPGAANTKNVGTKGYYLAAVKASIGSAEDVTFESLRFEQAGSAANADLDKVVVKSGTTEYPAMASGKYFVANFPGGLKVAKGASLEFSIKSDFVNGSARTVDMNILRKADIVVKGDVYKYYITAGGGSTGAASAGAFSSNQEPFFNAYAATIDKGSLLVSNSNKITATNIPIDVSDVIIGGFLFDTKGEPVQISSFKLNFTFSGSGTSSDLTGVKLFDSAGAIAAGPKDPASGILTWTDTWTAPVGENHYTVKGKLDTSFASNDTIQISVDPDDNLTAKGTVTGLSITPSPTTRVTSNTQTVKGGALAMSVSGTPFGQNVVRGVDGYLFATLIFDGNSSGEDVRVTSAKIRDTVSAAGVGDEINSCVLYDGATALNTGSDVVNPSDPTGTTNDLTFTLTNNLIVPKGTVKKVDLKCNISSNATANSFHQFGLNDTTGSNVVGAQTAGSITESVTTAGGAIMTLKTAGSYTIVKDASSPTNAIVLSGKTDVPLAVWKFHATDEAVDIKDVTLTFSSSTASTTDFLKATIWDGATKVGESVWAGSGQFATSTLTSAFVIPKDGDKLLTIKTDIASISTIASTTAGRLLAIHYDGNSSTSGTGVSSGQRLGSGSVTSFAGDVMQIMKTLPKVEKVAVPSSSIPQSDAILYRFKVSADAAGPVALYKFTFLVSSSTVTATSSNFRIFGYSDSGFSSSAYAQNPMSNNNVDCAGFSTFSDLASGATCGAHTQQDNYASTTALTANRGGGGGEVVFFFSPSANTASTSEAIQVPAGESRYFELRGDITNPGSGTGNSLQVSLLGDAARPVQHATPSGAAYFGGLAHRPLGPQIFHDNARGLLATAAGVAMGSADNDFVWSPMSTSTTLTGATSTTDWTNGFLVPGLPSTNLSANTFSN